MALRNALNLNRYIHHAELATWIEVAHTTTGMVLLRRLSVLRRGPQYTIIALPSSFLYLSSHTADIDYSSQKYKTSSFNIVNITASLELRKDSNA